MSLTTTTVQPQVATPTPAPAQPDHGAPLLTALMMSVYAAQLSRRQLRRLKRKATWALLKAQVKGLFSGRRDTGISTRTLLYTLLGIAVLILIFVAPVAAIILLLVGILLILLNR